jgi:Rieske Fe-S protein
VDRDRRLICKVGAALGAASLLPGCGNGSSGSDMGASCSANATAVGNIADVAVDNAVMHMTPSTNVFVCRDSDGFYAVDAGCTHLGCDVALKAAGDLKQGFACPCHGATYDANGLNPTAPAPTPLKHYALCVEPSGTLIVDVTEAGVDPKVRLKP